MPTKIIRAAFAGFWLSLPLSAGAQYSHTETIQFKITEKSRWQLEGAYNRIQIARTGSERVICLTHDGDMIMFDFKGKEMQGGAKNKQGIKIKRETLNSHYVVYDTTSTIMRINPLRYPFLSPTRKALVVFPRAFIPKRVADWKIGLYGADAALLWESAPPDFEEPAKSLDGLIPQITWLPQFSPNGEYFVIGVQNQLYMYNSKGLVWKYKDPDLDAKFNYSKAVISDDGGKTIVNLTKTHSSPSYLFDGKGKVVWERGFPGNLSVWLDERYMLLAGESGKVGVYDTQAHTLGTIILHEREYYEIKSVDYIQATGSLALLIEKSRSERGQRAYVKYNEAIQRKDEKAIFESHEEMEQKKLEVRLYEIQRQ